MNDKLPIILLDGETAGTIQSSQMDVVEMAFDVAGEFLPLHIGVRNGFSKLADIAPMARTLSSKITDAGLRHFERNGKTIPCRKGCGICCHYIVVLTVPDVFRLVEEVKQMPAQRRNGVMKSFDKINEWFEQQHVDNSQTTGISDWYSRLRHPCPFLYDNQCTIYENRPTVCREWLVTGTDRQCRKNNKVRRVSPSVHIGDVLKQLVSRLEDKSAEDVIFPTVFKWYSNNIEQSKRTWPAKLLVEQFVKILNNQMSD